MIPAAYISAWATQAPWPSDSDIEQDLILSRLMIEIANHDLLGRELAMRGGTCMHKLHLPEPLRYSDDLDYVRSTLLPYNVSSEWWSGRAEIWTFELDELLGTKLRALYQRSKGRDLFDLGHVLTHLSVDDDRVMKAHRHYIGDKSFNFSELTRNLRAKLSDPEFNADLEDLAVTPPAGYAAVDAADLVMERLGSRLEKAPSVEEIRSGAWRR